ncbi:MAG: TlpA family protein disulfide reductase [Sphingobacteriales bacterium]|nr:TlpA family protein disulfide reductase [Sphingobacteriales bacterium]
MIKQRSIALLIYVTTGCIHVCAQTAMTHIPMRLYTPSNTRDAKELGIGDNVPDVVFENVLNYPLKKAKLYDFKSRLTILDFWSTSCSACVDLFPHLQTLKNEFKDKLQIVLVNGKTSLFHDNETKIQNLLARLQQRSGLAINLPIVLNSEILDNYFPWKTIPHEVWLDSSGTVVGITGAMEVTQENISALLAGKKIKMHTKKDVSFDFQKQTLPELVYGSNSPTSPPMYSSTLIRGYVDGLRGQGVRHADSPYADLYTGWFITNQPLLRIYASAFRNIFKYPVNQVVVETTNPSRFETSDPSRYYKTDRYDIFRYSDVYSYDISVSPTKFDELLTYVQGDLERTFKTTVKSATRKMKCFVIKATPQLKISYSKGGEMVWETGIMALKKYIRNCPAKEILQELNNFSTTPLLDETGLSKNIDLDLPDDLWNTDLLLQYLRKAGFDISEEQREMNVVVISDK